jgi:ribonuclease P protein component
MLPKKNRLRKGASFKNIYKSGKRLSTPYFTLFYLQNKKNIHPQIGIIVSNKIGKATVRNKVKRRIREIIQSELENISNNLQIIILTKPTVANLRFQELKEKIVSTLENLRTKY